jgi:putative endonuclease
MSSSRRHSPADWTDARHRLGLAGEEAAIGFFARAGWSLMAHRFRVGRYELDLVVRRGNLVAFVEVKTRRGQEYGQGREAIGWRKRRTLTRVAEVWRGRHGQPEDLFRFDVVEVRLYPAGRIEITHLPDAWRGCA